MPPHVLLAAQDGLTTGLADGLREREFDVTVVDSIDAVRAHLHAPGADVVLLGEQLATSDGLVDIDALSKQVATVYLIKSTRTADVAVALKLGADDAVRLPVDLDLLTERIRAVVRRVRKAPVQPTDHTIGQLAWQPARATFTVNGKAVHLTWTEHQIIRYLITNPDRVLERDEISRFVWGVPDVSHGLDVHLHRARAKLRKAGLTEPHIEAVYGRGYILNTTTEVSAS